MLKRMWDKLPCTSHVVTPDEAAAMLERVGKSSQLDVRDERRSTLDDGTEVIHLLVHEPVGINEVTLRHVTTGNLQLLEPQPQLTFEI